MEIIKKTNIDFMGKRNIALAVSGILILIGFVAIIQIARGAANLGIDFAGGTSVQIKFNRSIPLQDIRDVLAQGDVTDFDLQDLPSENKILIRIKKGEETLGNMSTKIISILSQEFSESNVVVDSTTEIGPKVGARLRKDAMWAIMAAIIGILIYITVRFQFRFSVGATVATFHDVLAVLCIFYLMGKEINLILVSALLMIAGYSLTDTVVVFDRIRENLKFKGRKSTIDIVNQSLNEVLSRTIITSLTTFFAACALFVLGGEVIHDFAFAIMLGIIIGTYSSMFVASPIVLLMGHERAFSKR
ncbi:MAG: preprotein translocase subunit SecF [Nitrospira bacterium SG8_35_4]|nr:MAG: preprotein translocase subunit SecF [Nitrospira bacterium SG8_35_4]